MDKSRTASSKVSYLLMGMVLITIPLALNETFGSMIWLWNNSSNFTHCFLILPASAVLIWGRRERLSEIQPKASISGIPFIVGASLLWLLGSLANAAIIKYLAAVAFIPLAVWTVLGRRVAIEIAFPLLYLFFMVPFGEFLIPRLMEFTANFTVAAVRFSGIPIYRDGLFLTIPNGSFKVIEACSGARMLIAAFAVGVLFAHVSFSSWKRRIIFLAVTVLLAMVTNGLRAYTIVMIGHLFGIQAIDHHILLGYVFFGIFIILLLLVGSRFSDMHDDVRSALPDTSPPVSSGLRGFLSAGMVILIVVSTPITAAALHASITGQLSVEPGKLPAASGRWAGPSEVRSDWGPVYFGDYESDFGQYVTEAAAVDVYIVTYGYQTQGSEFINSQNSVFDREQWIQVRESAASMRLPAGQQWNYTKTELLAGDRKRLIKYWYTVDNKPASSQIQVKLAELKNAVRGRPSSSSVIAISTEFFDDAEAASATLDEFFTTVFADSYIRAD
jgi:exosortase A